LSSPEETFNALMGELDYPMFIVTAARGEERAGCLVGFATQCSIDPPRFLVCISRENRTFRLARDADLLAVHFVPADAGDLAELFGGHTGDEVDKFARCAWRPGPAGVPLLDRCDHRFVGRIEQRLDGGDHVAFLLSPVAAEHGHAEEGQFTFHRAKGIQAGHPA
jgi:flavin reductase (DIM6/NTAB) family NADH-FMN oxidoreductase RutF